MRLAILAVAINRLRRMPFITLVTKGYYIHMYYVYILKSINHEAIYTGSTNNLKERIKSHNNGQSKHTCKYKPWNIVWYAAFENKKTAIDFEKYLKTASGKAFSRKRLIKLSND